MSIKGEDEAANAKMPVNAKSDADVDQAVNIATVDSVRRIAFVAILHRWVQAVKRVRKGRISWSDGSDPLTSCASSVASKMT